MGLNRSWSQAGVGPALLTFVLGVCVLSVEVFLVRQLLQHLHEERKRTMKAAMLSGVLNSPIIRRSPLSYQSTSPTDSSIAGGNQSDRNTMIISPQSTTNDHSSQSLISRNQRFHSHISVQSLSGLNQASIVGALSIIVFTLSDTLHGCGTLSGKKERWFQTKGWTRGYQWLSQLFWVLSLWVLQMQFVRRLSLPPRLTLHNNNNDIRYSSKLRRLSILSLSSVACFSISSVSYMLNGSESGKFTHRQRMLSVLSNIGGLGFIISSWMFTLFFGSEVSSRIRLIAKMKARSTTVLLLGTQDTSQSLSHGGVAANERTGLSDIERSLTSYRPPQSGLLSFNQKRLDSIQSHGGATSDIPGLSTDLDLMADKNDDHHIDHAHPPASSSYDSDSKVERKQVSNSSPSMHGFSNELRSSSVNREYWSVQREYQRLLVHLVRLSLLAGSHLMITQIGLTIAMILIYLSHRSFASQSVRTNTALMLFVLFRDAMGLYTLMVLSMLHGFSQKIYRRVFGRLNDWLHIHIIDEPLSVNNSHTHGLNSNDDTSLKQNLL